MAERVLPILERYINPQNGLLLRISIIGQFTSVMKTIVTKYVCVLALIVSFLIPSTAGAYTQADIDAMFGTVQSLLAQIAQLIADRSSVAEVSTGACSISVFASGKSSIASGSSTAVYWEASSTCTTGRLKGGIFGSEGLSVSRVGEKNTGSLTKSTTYTLSFGTVSKSVTVTVASTGDQAPKDSSPVLPTISLSASPTSITAGQSTTLTWSSTNATSCTASNGWTGTKTTSGTQSVSPAVATTYSLTCTGTGGSATKSVVVPVTITTTPVPTITFSASPASISAGQSATLTWSSSDATSCTASGGWSGTKTTSGSESVSPTSNTNYALTCTGTGGSANQSAAVSVTTAPAPTVTLSASLTSITAGQSSTLTWSSTNATSCTASNGWTGTKTTSGTQSVSPTATTTYTLTCAGNGGSATKSVTVSIGTVTLPPTQKFAVGDTVQTTANLNVRGTAGGTLLGQQPLGALGKVLAGPVAAGDGIWWNVDYVNAPDGWSFEGYLVKSTVTPPPGNTPTVTLSASPTSITAGQSSTLTWSSTNATSCTASNGWTGIKTTSGTQSVSPAVATTYSLTCTGTGGSASQSVSVSVSSSNNKFIIGDSVQTTANLNVRGTPAGTILGQQPLRALGKVIGGPMTVQSANELSTWWNIDYANAPDGWSFEPYLIKSTVSPPPGTPTVNLSANPTSVTAGSTSTLAWSSTNATSCTASNGWTGTKTTSGTQSVSPTATTTYTLTCTGSAGSATQSVIVNVGTVTNPLPTVTLSASPTSITAGQSATLTWSSTNATSCSASGGWTGGKATSGTQSVSPTANTTYTLTCAGNGGSVTKNVAVNMSAVTGPVTLPIQPLIFQVPMPTQTGKVWTIPVGDSTAFQSALNQAQLGDTIELVAGSTYTGNFTFPKKATGSGWIVVRTNKHTSLPPSGVRVGPSDAVNMAKIVSTNTGNTLSFPSGSHHYRLIGLEVTNAISNTSYIQTAIVSIDPGSSLNSVDLPNNITLDRVYVHSQPTTGVQRCVRVDGAYVAVVDSYLGECHAKGFDSQAIAGWNTNGPIKIVNNMLEGAGENVMFGGADPTVQGAIPSDIEIRNNHIYTPTTWKGTGGTTLWTKKNLFEIKAGKRILVEGNVFDGSWSDGQVGHAILLRSTNQGGKCVWCQTTDFTARYNVVRNVGGTGNISGNAGSSNANKIGGLTSRVLFEHNLFQNINVAPYTGVGRLIELYNNAQDVTYRNNTWDPMGGAIQHYITGGTSPTATNFTYVDNIAPFGQYGVVPGYTEAALKAVVTGVYNYSGNVVYTNQPSNAYSTTKYPTTPLYSNYSTALSAGKGANIPAVLAATKNAVSGNGMGTTPPPLSVSNGPVFAITNTPVVLGESAVGLVFNRTLIKGMKGNDVTALQEVLSKLGFFTESISGYFGPVTEKAVQDLQLQYGIAASGTPETTGFGAVGPKTQQKLVELQK